MWNLVYSQFELIIGNISWSALSIGQYNEAPYGFIWGWKWCIHCTCVWGGGRRVGSEDRSIFHTGYDSTLHRSTVYLSSWQWCMCLIDWLQGMDEVEDKQCQNSSNMCSPTAPFSYINNLGYQSMYLKQPPTLQGKFTYFTPCYVLHSLEFT